MSTCTDPAVRSAAPVAAPAATPVVPVRHPFHDLPAPDRELLATWAHRVVPNAEATHQPVDGPRRDAVDLTAYATSPHLDRMLQRRWLTADGIEVALELARACQSDPRQFRQALHLPAAQRMLLAKHAVAVGQTLNHLGIATDTAAIEAGFYCLRDAQPNARGADAASRWVHADDLPAALTAAQQLQNNDTAADHLRLAALRSAEERRTRLVDDVLHGHILGAVPEDDRAQLRTELTALPAESLRLDATTAWNPMPVVRGHIARLCQDPAVVAAWTNALTGSHTTPFDIRSQIQRTVSTLVDRGLEPLADETLGSKLRFLGHTLIGFDVGRPGCAVSTIPGLPCPEPRFESLWPRLVALPLGDVPPGPLREQVLHLGAQIHARRAILSEIDELVQAEHPGAPPVPASIVAEAMSLLEVATDPSVADIAGAISWCYGRSLGAA
jgi:hypothetical protein